MTHTPSSPDSSLFVHQGILLAFCLLISFVGLFDHDVWTPDEPREAAIALDMAREGHWVIPRLAGHPFVEKPPLYYMVGALSLNLFAPWLGNTAALRLTSLFWGLGTLGMTYLLARRLMDVRRAVWTVLVLSTFPGFMHVTHWLLTDNALMFFVTASIWALAECYVGRKHSFLVWAGLFGAGAFLSKGLIGPMIIGLGWVGLLISAGLQRRASELFRGACLAWHGVALLAFMAPVAAWMLGLRFLGGPALWREWFWDNHFGRFTGQATHLGHVNGPGYYLEVLPVYVLPWAAWLLATLIVTLRSAWRERTAPPAWILAAVWGIGGVLLLSVSSTKRDIYLSVLLPAWALLAAGRLPATPGVWVNLWMRVWLMLLALALAVFAAAPAWGSLLGAPASGWKGPHLLAALAALLSLFVMSLKSRPLMERFVLITALASVTLLTVIPPVVDPFKSYGAGFKRMAVRIHVAPADRVIGWNLDETTRAGFYYYCDLAITNVSDIVSLVRVLKGEDGRYSKVLVDARRFPPPEGMLPPWKTSDTVMLGGTRGLKLIERRPVLPDEEPSNTIRTGTRPD